METNSAEQILQKISFIEKDIELHKNILMTLPEGQEKEMEEVITTIAELKKKADSLKASIAEVDPAMHEKVQRLEKAGEEFRNLTEGRELTQVVSLDHHGECKLELVDGTRLECLVKALDAEGNWTVLTVEGEALQYPADEVQAEH